jgi:hypothetical protein
MCTSPITKKRICISKEAGTKEKAARMKDLEFAEMPSVHVPNGDLVLDHRTTTTRGNLLKFAQDAEQNWHILVQRYIHYDIRRGYRLYPIERARNVYNGCSPYNPDFAYTCHVNLSLLKIRDYIDKAMTIG